MNVFSPTASPELRSWNLLNNTSRIFGAEIIAKIIFIVAPWMLIVLSLLFVQPMHTNYYTIVKQLKSFKIIIVAPTCFGLHKPSSGSSQPVFRWSYSVDFGYISYPVPRKTNTLSQENNWMKKGLLPFVRDSTQIQLQCKPTNICRRLICKMRVSYQERRSNRPCHRGNPSALNIKRSSFEFLRIPRIPTESSLGFP